MKIKLAVAAALVAGSLTAHAGPRFSFTFSTGGGCYRPAPVMVCRPVVVCRPAWGWYGAPIYTTPVFVRRAVAPSIGCGTTFRVARPIRPVATRNAFSWR